MGDKSVVSLNLSDENIEWLEHETDNRSTYVDDILTEVRENGGSVDDIMREFQIKQLRSEIAIEQSSLEAKQEQLDSLLEEREQQTSRKNRVVEEAVDVLGGDDLGQAQAEHWAGKADIPVDEFKEAYNEVRGE